MSGSKYEQPFAVKILDDDFNLVTLLSYASLQWDREYNQAGKFVIEGALGDYDRKTWIYVYTEKRKELGRITQVNWKKTGNKQTLSLSGKFIEEDLNNMVCYTRPSHFDDDSGVHTGTSILSTDSPTWVTQEGTADVVARAFFNGFKQISFRNYDVGDFDGTGGIKTRSFELPISFGTIESGDYHYSIHNRNNEYLGNKLYDILKESNASVEVLFDYSTKERTLNIIHGVDRTQTNHAFGVNPILMSSKNGSIKSASIVTSNTQTKDAVIQTSEEEDKTMVLANALPDSIGRFMTEQMSANESDFANNDNGFKLSVMADASTKLHDKEDVVNLQFDFVSSSYRYMEDFDLGDIISVEIPEIGISIDAQIVSCHETIKSGAWQLNMEVGSSILRKRGKF